MPDADAGETYRPLYIRIRRSISYQQEVSGIKKIIIIVLWIAIALGLYRCGLHLDDTGQVKTEEIKGREGIKGTDQPGQTDGTRQEKKDVQSILPFDKTVRILIMDQGFQDLCHQELCISGSEGMRVEIGGRIEEFAPGSEWSLRADSLEKDEKVTIQNKEGGRLWIRNIARNGQAQYRGKLECYPADGGIVVVNELSVEEYLYGVVPSEMPSTYPEEALKAQAVSARTYTYFHKQSYAYPQWRAHMDDSTAFQVYMNFDEAESTSRAVDATKDQVLTYDGSIVESFYYSTSGGSNGGAPVWEITDPAAQGYLIETGEEIFASCSDEGEAAYKAYIDNGNTEDVEYGEAWYRWVYEKEFDEGAVKEVMQRIYALSRTDPQSVRIRSRYLPSDRLGEETGIRDIRVSKRQKSGLVTAILIETEHFQVYVRTQNMIRKALGCSGDTLERRDGSTYTMGELLPSAYFYIERSYDKNGENGDAIKKIVIHGAGLGHGCGMSQNGAKCLAQRGSTAGQILAYYYDGSIKAVDELDWAAGATGGTVRNVEPHKSISSDKGISSG